MPASIELSALDRDILCVLQDDPRISMANLAEKVNSSVSPCWRRVKRMEDAGVIRDYNLQLDRKALGFGIDAFVFVKIVSHMEQHAQEFEQAVSKLGNVLCCYILSGMDDYLIRVVASDLDTFANFSRKVLAALPHVKEVRSTFVMHEIKETQCLPLQSMPYSLGQ
ncbi:Lrp/AsnC family transcriptional regulator [Pseudomonas chlororaphis]|uniref:Lrp/AsnC family transcriptional regulator n=1 Tax=Pseudomonas chlororaphis TaxID=587753 RepID=UPI000D10B95D|nr:Lrp/AsnC family transcriptional regulator [Pseudomonas chlororaphis]AVO60087.1 Lrp/AsnC family transcriptional regulator [Pseudomonas chlororaphis subsp. piscium]